MKNVKRIFAILMVAIMAFMMFPAAVSAAEHLDTSEPIDFKLLCNKLGYEFTVYQVGTLDTDSTSPYSTKYTSLINDIADEVLSGETSDVLAALDAIETIPDTATEVGKFTVTETTVEKTFENLAQGIYYVRATNFPAGVKSVTNSVFALPYYDGTAWQYKIDDIELATKVVEGKPTTEKNIIGNSDIDDGDDLVPVMTEDYTAADLGDVITYEILSTTAGSASMKLGSYTIYDIMSKGLTLCETKDFVVTLKDADGKVIRTLTQGTDYTVNPTTTDNGTEFTIDLTDAFLQTAGTDAVDFYDSNVMYVSAIYTATLNKDAVVGVLGNPNEEVKLEYSNKNGVFDEVAGNTVYVYTYKVTANKTDEKDQPLAGSTFYLYDNADEAEAMTEGAEIAVGVSDAEGKVVFKTNGEEISLKDGTYYAVEISAPEGYNVYGHVITIDLTATYTDTFNGTSYVESCVENGTATFKVQNTKLVLPETGGTGRAMIYVVAVATLLAGAAFVTVYAVRKRKASEQ